MRRYGKTKLSIEKLKEAWKQGKITMWVSFEFEHLHKHAIPLILSMDWDLEPLDLEYWNKIKERLTKLLSE